MSPVADCEPASLTVKAAALEAGPPSPPFPPSAEQCEPKEDAPPGEPALAPVPPEPPAPTVTVSTGLRSSARTNDMAIAPACPAPLTDASPAPQAAQPPPPPPARTQMPRTARKPG